MVGMARGGDICAKFTSARAARIFSSSASEEANVSYVVIKTINGRQYYYEQTARYLNGKRTPVMRYIGPVSPKRRRGIKPGDVFRAIFEVGGYVAVKGTSRPSYKTKNRPPDPRSARHMLERERQRWEQRIEDAKAGYGRPKTKAEQDPEWRAFDEKLAASRQTAQDAPGRAQTSKAKDFTVDDEIEAREAKFEAAVDEYNAGTTAAPDAPAPDDAPSPSAPHEL
jgi:hypothetical protein